MDTMKLRRDYQTRLDEEEKKLGAVVVEKIQSIDQYIFEKIGWESFSQEEKLKIAILNSMTSQAKLDALKNVNNGFGGGIPQIEDTLDRILNGRTD